MKKFLIRNSWRRWYRLDPIGVINQPSWVYTQNVATHFNSEEEAKAVIDRDGLKSVRAKVVEV